jgi:hypothetical protein
MTNEEKKWGDIRVPPPQKKYTSNKKRNRRRRRCTRQPSACLVGGFIKKVKGPQNAGRKIKKKNHVSSSCCRRKVFTQEIREKCRRDYSRHLSTGSLFLFDYRRREGFILEVLLLGVAPMEREKEKGPAQ